MLALVEVARAEARLVEVRSRLLSHAETVAVAETNASPSVAVWHANATRSTKRESFREVRLAAGLERYDVVREALGRGDVIAEQAAKALVPFVEIHDAKGLRGLLAFAAPKHQVATREAPQEQSEAVPVPVRRLACEAGVVPAVLGGGSQPLDVHHDDPWSHHGHTDLARGRLLCPHHHRRIHDPEYETDVGGDNQVTFHRRV